MERNIEHAESGDHGAFFITQDGSRVAELTYRRSNAALITINHTGVDSSLKGQGVARRLLDAAVIWARESHTKIISACPFSTAQFSKDADIRDVLA